MTLPLNNNRSSAEAAKDRDAVRAVRKPGPSVFAKELPNTRRLNDADVRKAGIRVLSMMGDTKEAREILDILGITQHLNGIDAIIVRPLNPPEPQ